MQAPYTRESLIVSRNFPPNIKGDAFSLELSCYPVAAQYLAERIGDKEMVAAELCCGVGTILTNLAEKFKRVIGVEIEKQVLSDCKENLKMRGLDNRATLMLGDIQNEAILKQIKADVVVYDIPYWEPHKYLGRGDVRTKNPDLKAMMRKIRQLITENIVLSIAPDYTHEYLAKEFGECENEKIFIDGRHDRNFVYFGELIKSVGESSIRLNNT